MSAPELTILSADKTLGKFINRIEDIAACECNRPLYSSLRACLTVCIGPTCPTACVPSSVIACVKFCLEAWLLEEQSA